MLHQMCKERKMWTIHCHTVTFRQLCLKVVICLVPDMKLVWYAGLILWHQVQVIVSLS